MEYAPVIGASKRQVARNEAMMSWAHTSAKLFAKRCLHSIARETCKKFANKLSHSVPIYCENSCSVIDCWGLFSSKILQSGDLESVAESPGL